MEGGRYVLKVIFNLFLMLSISVNVLALPSVHLEGNSSDKMVIEYTEPFLLGKDMIPGDKVSRELIIENNYNVPYELFIQAKRVSPHDEYDLLDKLELTINYDNRIIYKGPASGEVGLKDNVSLGVFNPGDTRVLYAEAVLDSTVTERDYESKSAQVDFIFTATTINQSITTEQTKPPKTGDDGLMLYVILLVAGIGIIVIFNIKTK